MPTAEMMTGTIIGEIRIAMIVARRGKVGARQAEGRQRAEEGGEDGGRRWRR